MAGLCGEEGVLAHGDIGVGAELTEQSVLQAIQALQGPEGEDAGLRTGVATDQRRQGADGRGLQAGVTFHEYAQGVETDGLARMRKCGEQAGDVGLGKVGNGELRGGVMLDAIDAAEIVFAVRTDGGA